MSTTSFEDRLEQGNAPAWRPDKEDADLLVGKVVTIDRGQSDYEPYPILTIEKEDGTGEVAVHGFHTVLKNELVKQQPQVGERIGIKYLGEITSGQRPYIGYRVKVDRTESTFSWATMGEPAASGEAAYDPRADGLEGAEPGTVPTDAQDDDIPF